MKRGYKEKVDPTEKGFDELDESTRHATIERLIAGIQAKKTKPEDILKLTEHFRKRHSMEDGELYRLGVFSKDYNKLWATKHNRCHGSHEVMLSKRQSQYKSWREILKATTPRFKPRPNEAENPQSLYDASYLTYRPYELDMWGPASYGTLVYDLWNELDIIVNHMQDGRQLCNDIMAEEAAIDKDPERKEQLFWAQYWSVAEKNHDTIEYHIKKGIVNTDNPVYKKMLAYPNTITDLAQNDFHVPSETQMSDFVVLHQTLIVQENEITHQESELLGNNFEKIKLLRFAVEHLDELLPKKGQRFDKLYTLIFIKWCHVLKSGKRKDNEHELFNYIRGHYIGYSKFYGWPSLFELRNSLGSSENVWKQDVAAFNEKLTNLYKTYTEQQNEHKNLNG